MWGGCLLRLLRSCSSETSRLAFGTLKSTSMARKEMLFDANLQCLQCHFMRNIVIQSGGSDSTLARSPTRQGGLNNSGGAPSCKPPASPLFYTSSASPSAGSFTSSSSLGGSKKGTAAPLYSQMACSDHSDGMSATGLNQQKWSWNFTQKGVTTAAANCWSLGVLGGDYPLVVSLHSYRKSPCSSWVNPLFRLGHVQ